MKANPRNIQFQKDKPPGNTIKYIKVVQGKNIIPNKGTINDEKVRLNLKGWNIHQKIVATLGPRKSKITNKHIILF